MTRGHQDAEARTGGGRLRWRLIAAALMVLAVAAGALVSVRAVVPLDFRRRTEVTPERDIPARAGPASSEESSDEGAPSTIRATPAPPVWSDAEPTGPIRALRQALDGVIDGARWSRARWSVLAVSLDRGDILYARKPDLMLAPASNVKILTTASALYYLGPDFRYATYVLAPGEVEDGVVQGDLVLYGTGDPTLSDRFYRSETEVFRRLAQQLRAQGVRAVAGDLVGDGSYFTGPAVEPTWNPADVNEWFAAPVSALAFNENMVALRIAPAGWVGAPPRIQTLPPGAGIEIENRARTVAGAPEPYRRLAVIRPSLAEPIQVVGEIAAGSSEVWREMTVADPPLFAATLLADVLEAEGIRIYGSVRSEEGGSSVLTPRALWAPAFSSQRAPRILAEQWSPPLQDLLEVVNNESHNLFAEAVFRSVGANVVGEASFAGAVTATRRFLAEEVGVDADEVVQVDGSGLSPENRVSARAFVKLVAYMEDSPLAEAFRETLPEAGNRRELARMYRSSAAGNLRAKTGTIDRVSSLTGTVRSASGERIAFSIISNGVPSTWRAKRLEDRIGVHLAEFRRP